jgi:hypothetical protein
MVGRSDLALAKAHEGAAARPPSGEPVQVRRVAYPTRHRRRWRSTKLLERSLGEVRRRTKVIGRFPGETSCLTLVWAVLDLYVTHATNGINFTQLERQRLKQIRYEGHDHALHEEVNAAQTDHHLEPEPPQSYSSSGTRPRLGLIAALDALCACRETIGPRSLRTAMARAAHDRAPRPPVVLCEHELRVSRGARSPCDAGAAIARVPGEAGRTERGGPLIQSCRRIGRRPSGAYPRESASPVGHSSATMAGRSRKPREPGAGP